MKRMVTILLSLLLCSSVMFGQGSLSGKVTDLQTGEPLIGANVLITGSSFGAATDVDGNYQIRNLNAGTYEVRASYVGYQSITVSNVRITTDLTTDLNFQLPSEGISVDEIFVIAERPLIQRDNTNAIRTTTSEDIDALPIRGVTNIIALEAGVVEKDDQIFIRGGRIDEVGYYLEGTNITNPIVGGRAVTLSQDAIEEIQVQAGGYTAEFGGANAGIIRQTLKTGSSQFKGSIEYITDNIGFKSKDDFHSGDERLGAYWFGYNELSAVLSGPIVDPRFRFFVNFNYIYQGDQTPQPYPGIDIGVIDDPFTNQSIDFNYPAGPVFGNSRDAYTYTGTINADFNPIILRLSGTYTDIRADARTQPSGIINVTGFMNPRLGQTEGSNGTFNLKMTHIVSSNLFYEISGGYFLSQTERFDRDLKDNIWAYGDSVTNAAHGWVYPSRFQDPQNIVVYGFEFASYGAIPTTYAKNERNAITFNGSLNWKIGKIHDLKIGGEFQQYTLRNWGLSIATDALASLLNTSVNAAANAGRPLADVQRDLLRIQGVTAYGYDEFGNEYDGDGFLAPHKPVFISGYIQDKIEYEDLVLNLGLRLDHYDVDNLMLVDPSRPELAVNRNSGELIEEGWKEVPTYTALSPRLGFSFPVTERTVFHAQFGQFVQQTQLIDMYEGYYRTSYQFRNSFFFGSPAGKNIRPTRTTQYEIGFTQQ
ncbi:MAG: carboxypeptidase-like regulatory domain-containing protein, partial [Ignavibacteriaceae bacterium]